MASTVIQIKQGGTGQSTANAALNAILPSQTGNNGKILQTDGTNTSWVSPSAGSGLTYQEIMRVKTILNNI